MFKLIIRASMLLVLIALPGFAQMSCVIDQIVSDLPVGYDITGTHWYVYKISDPSGDVITQDSSGSMTIYFSNSIFWSGEIGTGFYPPQPQVGDSIITFGCWDSAYASDSAGYLNNPNHMGFYWIYSDILHDEALDHWQTDTLRPLPQPAAAQIGTDIEIAIPNPRETRYTGQTAYDILGYWIWADTTGIGTPDSYDKEITYVPIQGVYGDTTTYLHPIAGNYADGQTVYWAYKLVSRPALTFDQPRQAAGYTSYYYSCNSNPIIIIGIEETSSTAPRNTTIQAYPNPFGGKIDISLNAGLNTEHVRLRIFNAAGNLVRTYLPLLASPYSNTVITWCGLDQMGNKVPAGVYFVKLEAAGHAIIEKIVKVE